MSILQVVWLTMTAYGYLVNYYRKWSVKSYEIDPLPLLAPLPVAMTVRRVQRDANEDKPKADHLSVVWITGSLLHILIISAWSGSEPRLMPVLCLCSPGLSGACVALHGTCVATPLGCDMTPATPRRCCTKATLRQPQA